MCLYHLVIFTSYSFFKAIGKNSPSSVADSSRENNCTPTEEFIDESDDNWESYSSDDSDSAVDVADDSVVTQRQPNRKNVAINNTIARLQQSIGTTSNLEGVEKLDKSVTQSESEGGTKVPLTYETLASEAMHLDGDNAKDDVKTCVSNGRSPNSHHSFSFGGTGQIISQLGSRNGNNGGASSNADLTNNDVDMVDVNKPGKILTRIDNIGYTRSDDSSVSFCCLINECGFESPDLSNLLYHIDDHPVQWFGYCYSCDAQIENDQVQLMMEFKHMTTVHYNKMDDSDNTEKMNVAGKPTLIKCKSLPGDKLSKLKEEEEITARAQKLNIGHPKPSTSSSVTGETKFLRIANVKSLIPNTLTLVKPKSSGVPMITKVVSLGSISKEYNETEVVSLKEWLSIPTIKLQKHCKRMLRDICLYALFKCMDMNCAFTTDNADKMLIHLRNHENGSTEPKWLECAYCNIVADSCALLVKHIQDEHQSSIFQCPYCFYRSCAAFNVVVHLKQFHPNEKVSVLVCIGKPRLYATEKALIEKSRRENIRPLRCTEGKSLASSNTICCSNFFFGPRRILKSKYIYCVYRLQQNHLRYGPFR